MSDKFYAVQFRSMHTAIHSVAVFSVEAVALELLGLMNEHEEMPDELAFSFDRANFVGMYEIDFRNPPTCQGDPADAESLPLIYVNSPDNNIPDVYGY